MSEEAQPSQSDAAPNSLNQPLPLVASASEYPTVFADGCIFATLVAGTVRLQFAETIAEAANSTFPGAKNRYVGTLVVPVTGFEATLSYLNKCAQDWGLVEAPSGD